MKCEEVIKLMHRELDGDINPKERQGLLKHLASCPDCHILFDQLKSLSFQLESLPCVTPAYSIVDKVLPILDKVDQTQKVQGLSSDENSEQPNKSVITIRKLWIPGLTLVATLFIALLISNSAPDMDHTAQDLYDQSSENYEMSNIEVTDDGDNRLAGASEKDSGEEEIASSDAEEPNSKESNSEEPNAVEQNFGEPNSDAEGAISMSSASEDEDKNEQNEQTTSVDFASLEEDYIEYNSPDGVYSAYEGFGDEDIRIKKEDRPYYMTKNQNQWEKPWEVISIEWISNNELYYILSNPEQDEQQYWMLYADERIEEQLEEPYVTEDK